MRFEEAKLIRNWIQELELEPGSICLNLGSSTGEFREVTQPHIAQELFLPVEQMKIRVIHCDMKPAGGVHEVGDLLDPSVQSKLQGYRAKLVICSNLLEHLNNREAFARACGDLIAPGGYAIFTVPRSYPYHPDPIDTLYRPSPSQIAELIPGWILVRSIELEAGNHWSDMRARGGLVWSICRQIVRSAMPFYKPRHWLMTVHRLLWLTRAYKVSAILIQKPF